MSSYILSNANRFYTALESSYGQVPVVAASNRFPAVKLKAKQQIEAAQRRDKTGSRTFAGQPAGGRRRTSYEVTTYLANWPNPAQDPPYGPLLQAGLGGSPLRFAGAAAGAGSSGSTLVFGAAHGLAVRQAVSYAGEIRFVTAVV